MVGKNEDGADAAPWLAGAVEGNPVPAPCVVCCVLCAALRCAAAGGPLCKSIKCGKRSFASKCSILAGPSESSTAVVI
jgi:hypothetical protein